MSYRIELSSAARADIRALPGYIRAQALQLIDAMADSPTPSRAKELRGMSRIYRIWLAGRWRVVYEVDDGAEVILILRVRSKDRIEYSDFSSE